MAEYGVAFAGSAFLLPYYVGVATVMLKEAFIVPGHTRMGGLSGGAVTSAFCHGGKTIEEFETTILGYVEHCIELNYTSPCYQQMYQALMEKLPVDLPDLHSYVNRNLIRVAVSELDSNRPMLSSPMVYTHVSNKKEFFDVLGASTYLSCHSGDTPYVMLNGKPVIDGGYSATFKELCPPSIPCVKISSYYVGEYTTEREPGLWDCVPMLGPLGESVVRPAAILNNKSAKPIAIPEPMLKTTSIPIPFEPVGKLPSSCIEAPPMADFTRPGPADIYPGQYLENPIPYSCGHWQQLSMYPTRSSLPIMVQLGRKDAEIWLQQRRAKL
jgi:hypothetical protein